MSLPYQITKQSLALGINAGGGVKNNSQGNNAIAIGNEAGQNSQQTNTVAIGNKAGKSNQGLLSIAIGNEAGFDNQNISCVALGEKAGKTNQGNNSIAIGKQAGETDQSANTIILNATGNALNSDSSNATYIAPVRGTNTLEGSKLMYYNTTTKEVTYTNDGSIDLSCGVINDVSGITFCDGTYIGQGNSFDISTNQILKVNQDALVVDTNKNIGIGTVDPSDILHIVRNQAGSTRIHLENTDANGLTTLRFTSDQGAAAAIYENANNDFTIQNATPNGALRLQTTDNSNITKNAIYIDGSQNIGIGTISPSCSLDINNRSDAIAIPSGTSLERPANPVGGMMRYNRDNGVIEYYNDIPGVEDWQSIFGAIAAIGGTITEIIDNGIAYRVHTFTTVGEHSFIVLSGRAEAEYLVVAGGGGGGGNSGFNNPRASGGGGAGGVVMGFISIFTETISVTVGGGGSGNSNGTGTNGSNSLFNSIEAIGGGGGGGRDDGGASGNSQNGKNGGSGGGAGRQATSAGKGTSGQGNDGGISQADNAGNGGGGAGGVGQNGVDNDSTSSNPGQAGDGGVGLESEITGTPIFYAGGGGGGGSNDSARFTEDGDGGLGGGGDAGDNGEANTGGGGGAGGTTSQQNAGNGGSGIVIIRYRI